jgi:putative transposase
MGELCGFEVTSTEVSRATADLDTMFEAWRNRKIDEEIAHLIVDATYEKVRVGSEVRSCALLIAIGVRKSDGKRIVLGCSVSLSEAEVNWREFFNSLKRRGLGLPRMITSDAHEGLKAAVKACFPGVLTAALPVPPAAQCASLRSKNQHENGCRCRHSPGFRR